MARSFTQLFSRSMRQNAQGMFGSKADPAHQQEATGQAMDGNGMPIPQSPGAEQSAEAEQPKHSTAQLGGRPTLSELADPRQEAPQEHDLDVDEHTRRL